MKKTDFEKRISKYKIELPMFTFGWWKRDNVNLFNDSLPNVVSPTTARLLWLFAYCQFAYDGWARLAMIRWTVIRRTGSGRIND